MFPGWKMYTVTINLGVILITRCPGTLARSRYRTQPGFLASGNTSRRLPANKKAAANPWPAEGEDRICHRLSQMDGSSTPLHTKGSIANAGRNSHQNPVT